jgi:hypothetical protein
VLATLAWARGWRRSAFIALLAVAGVITAHLAQGCLMLERFGVGTRQRKPVALRLERPVKPAGDKPRVADAV